MTQQLEVGKTYTSVNDMKFFCIALDDGIAHMRHADSPRSAALAWLLDGTPLTVREDGYRIVFEPERGELVLHGRLDEFDEWEFDTYSISSSVSHRLTIPTLDGKIPEGEVTIKVEKL